MFGVDFSDGPPTAGELKRAGAKFVGRYHGTGSGGKLLTRDEATALKRAGIAIVSIYETWGFSRPQDRSRLNHAGGVEDAKHAAGQAAACGAPADVVVYFTIDYDAPPGDQRRINDYLAGCAAVLGGSHRVGLYAGYYPLKRALDAGACAYGMQTRAWSGGQWDHRAQIRQFPDGASMSVHIGGVECDRDESTSRDFGQWGGQKSAPLVDVLVNGKVRNTAQRVDNPALWVRVQALAQRAQRVEIVRSGS